MLGVRENTLQILAHDKSVQTVGIWPAEHNGDDKNLFARTVVETFKDIQKNCPDIRINSICI